MTMPPQEQAKPTMSGDLTKEFVCESGDCTSHAASKDHVMKIGSKYATALAGFVAGVLVGIIALYPLLQIMGKICADTSV